MIQLRLRASSLQASGLQGLMEVAMTRITSFASFDNATTIRRYRSIWSRFINRVIAARTPAIGHEIEEHLERHRYDLSPEVRIELERHNRGRYSDQAAPEDTQPHRSPHRGVPAVGSSSV